MKKSFYSILLTGSLFSQSWFDEGVINYNIVQTSENPEDTSVDLPQPPFGGTAQHYYKIKAVDAINNHSEFSAQLNVTGAGDALDKKNEKEYTFNLNQNYPNPFNPTTRISYSLKESTPVSLVVYDMLGNKVAELVSETQDAGEYTVNFDGSALTSGVYIYRLRTENFTSVQKMALIK